MVDLDIGTENLRWMGDARFVLGFLKGVVSNSNFKARIRINVVEDDKIHMARIARERSHVAPATMGEGQDPLNPGRQGRNKSGAANTQLDKKPNGNGKSSANGTEEEGKKGRTGEKGANSKSTSTSTSTSTPKDEDKSSKTEPEDDGPLPEAKPLQPDDTWLTIDSGGKTPKVEKREDGTQAIPDSILYFYAGMMPWVSRDLNQWPVATCGQGVVDIAIQRVVCSSPFLCLEKRGVK